MKALWARFNTYLPRLPVFWKYSFAILTVIFFTFYVGNVLSKQAAITPQNPMEDYADEGSQVLLASESSQSSKADGMLKSDVNKDAENQKESNKQEMEKNDSDKEQVNERPISNSKEPSDDPESNQPEINQTVTPSPSESKEESQQLPEPETPQQPEEKVEPEQPEETMTPQQPEEKVEPEQPEEPETPQQPEEKVEPEQPEETMTPQQPEEKVEPEQPEEKVEPEQPEGPETPQQPEEKVEPEQPEEGSQQPQNPDEGEGNNENSNPDEGGGNNQDSQQPGDGEGTNEDSQQPGESEGNNGGSQQPGSGDGSNNEQQPGETNNGDGSDVIIVDPDESNEELEDNEYFTTTIIDNEVVTQKEYSFAIIQKQHDFSVNEIAVFINNDLVPDFAGSVTLNEGNNNIRVSVTYQDQKGKVFTVSKDYTVILEKGEIIIYSSLEQQMEVTKKEMIFTAYAQRDGKDIAVTVIANGKELKADRDGKYSIDLSKGENTIIISASDDSGETAEKEYTILFNPADTNLRIETDLKDQEVTSPEFDFLAEAFDGKKKANLKVEVNGEVVKGKNGSYSVTLKEGNNHIVLTAYNDEENLIQEYYIALVKANGEEESDEEADKKAPIIITDLVDGTTIVGTIKTFNVWPVDYEGNRIRGSNVMVTVNGVGVPFTWDDSTKTSYKLDLRNGENEVVITVWDSEGRTATETFIVYSNEVAEGEVIGQATISIEATTVGLGYLIPPTVVDIRQGEKTSYLLDQLLSEYGFEYTYTGSIDNGFYLSGIVKPGLVTNPVIPEDLYELVEESSTRFDENDYDSDWLGEFSFANGSGWMYSVNGDYPNYGFADSYLLDGDVVRIRFTLHYGKDIGGYGSMGGGSGGDWHKEW